MDQILKQRVDLLRVENERLREALRLISPAAQSRRPLTDSEIGVIWFQAKIPGLNETNARLLIRAAERKIRELQ